MKEYAAFQGIEICYNNFVRRQEVVSTSYNEIGILEIGLPEELGKRLLACGYKNIMDICEADPIDMMVRCSFDFTEIKAVYVGVLQVYENVMSQDPDTEVEMRKVYRQMDAISDKAELYGMEEAEANRLKRNWLLGYFTNLYDEPLALEELSSKARSVLARSGTMSTYELYKLLDNGSLQGMKNAGARIEEELKSYLEKKTNGFRKEIEGFRFPLDENCRQALRGLIDKARNTDEKPVHHRNGLLVAMDYVEKYLEENDSFVDVDKLSGRAQNALRKAHILTNQKLYEVIQQGELGQVKNLGSKGEKEVLEYMDALTARIQEEGIKEAAIIEEAQEDHEAHMENAMKNLEDLFLANSTRSFEALELLDLVDKKYIKDLDECIICLLEKHFIANAGGRYCLSLPSFAQCVEKMDKGDDAAKILKGIMEGRQIEQIARRLRLDSTRARRLMKQRIERLRNEIYLEYQSDRFAEDRWQYVFETYDISKDIWIKGIGVSPETYCYLEIVYKKGRKDKSALLSDPKVDSFVRNTLARY